jgi:hypothetical protein
VSSVSSVVESLRAPGARNGCARLRRRFRVFVGFVVPVYPLGVTETPSPRVDLTEGSRIVVSPQQLSCDLAGEAAIVNLTTGVYFGLDAMGARIWNLIREQTTFAEIRERIASLYDVEPHQLERDLREFFGQLADQGLIEIS